MKLLVLLLHLPIVLTAYDVPLRKAVPPLMEPRAQVPNITNRVFLQVQIPAGPETGLDVDLTGKIVLGLFGDVAPKIVRNFVSLARCDQGNGVVSGKPLCFKGSTFHRIIPGFMIQGGDFVNNDGTGGETIYGTNLIEDESFEVEHNRPYLLNSSNKGKPDSNGSQFFISTVKTPWLDGKYLAFGLVLDGQDLIKQIEHVGTSWGTPKATVTVFGCGEMNLTKKDSTVKHW